MGQQGLRQRFAQLVIDGRSTRRHTVTTAVTTKRAKESAVRRAGMHAVQTIDDVQSFLKGLKRFNGLGKLGLGQ